MDNQALEEATTATSRTDLIARWQSIPLYARIVTALVLGVMVGMMLGSEAGILAVPALTTIRGTGRR